MIPDRLLELLAVVMISVASLSAAWSGYQASRWGGEQSTFYSQASATRVESSRASSIGYMTALGDLTVFNAWAEATALDNQALIEFNENRFSPALSTAVADWLALDPLNDPEAPGGPFADNLYVNEFMVEADQLEEEAAATFQKGRDANARSDAYVMLTVIFAMVLFFGGISSRLTWYLPKILVLGLAMGLLVFGLARLATFPIA